MRISMVLMDEEERERESHSAFLRPKYRPLFHPSFHLHTTYQVQIRKGY